MFQQPAPVLSEVVQIAVVNLLSAVVLIAFTILTLVMSHYLSLGPDLLPENFIEPALRMKLDVAGNGI